MRKLVNSGRNGRVRDRGGGGADVRIWSGTMQGVMATTSVRGHQLLVYQSPGDAVQLAFRGSDDIVSVSGASVTDVGGGGRSVWRFRTPGQAWRRVRARFGFSKSYVRRLLGTRGERVSAQSRGGLTQLAGTVDSGYGTTTYDDFGTDVESLASSTGDPVHTAGVRVEGMMLVDVESVDSVEPNAGGSTAGIHDRVTMVEYSTNASDPGAGTRSLVIAQAVISTGTGQRMAMALDDAHPDFRVDGVVGSHVGGGALVVRDSNCILNIRPSWVATDADWRNILEHLKTVG